MKYNDLNFDNLSFSCDLSFSHSCSLILIPSFYFSLSLGMRHDAPDTGDYIMHTSNFKNVWSFSDQSRKEFEQRIKDVE